KQSERVPPHPPGIADARMGVEYQERKTTLLQVITHRQSCLAAAYDQCLHAFGSLHARHLTPPSRPSIASFKPILGSADFSRIDQIAHRRSRFLMGRFM